MALGEAVEPDYRALPRATYTDPEAASVGRDRSRRRARPGIDAFELVADFAKSAKGYARPGQARPRDDRRRPRARASWSARRWPARTPRRRSTSASSRSRPASRSTSWPRRSTPSRRRRGSSTGCSPTRDASWTSRASVDADALALEDDLAVDEDDATAGPCASAPPGSTGLVDGGRRDDDDVGALADRQPAAIALARRRRPGRRTPRAARARA